jgi:ATP-dependent Clp protease ATP-binding subunit ClpA
MSSNLGTKESAKNILGFLPSTSGKSESSKAVDSFFLTELRGRLTGIIDFGKLDTISLRKIAYERINDISNLIASRNIKLIASDRLIDHILELNNESQYGARRIAGIVDSIIKYPFSVELLNGNISNNSMVNLDWNNDKLTIKPAISTIKIPLNEGILV